MKFNYITLQDLVDLYNYTPDDDIAPQAATYLEFASDKINYITGNRIQTIGFDKLSESQQNLVKKATARYAWWLMSQGQEWFKGSVNISTGGFSVSKSESPEPDYVIQDVYGLLQQAGLYVPRDYFNEKTKTYGSPPVYIGDNNDQKFNDTYNDASSYPMSFFAAFSNFVKYDLFTVTGGTLTSTSNERYEKTWHLNIPTSGGTLDADYPLEIYTNTDENTNHIKLNYQANSLQVANNLLDVKVNPNLLNRLEKRTEGLFVPGTAVHAPLAVNASFDDYLEMRMLYDGSKGLTLTDYDPNNPTEPLKLIVSIDDSTIKFNEHGQLYAVGGSGSIATQIPLKTMDVDGTNTLILDTATPLIITDEKLTVGFNEPLYMDEQNAKLSLRLQPPFAYNDDGLVLTLVQSNFLVSAEGGLQLAINSTQFMFDETTYLNLKTDSDHLVFDMTKGLQTKISGKSGNGLAVLSNQTDAGDDGLYVSTSGDGSIVDYPLEHYTNSDDNKTHTRLNYESKSLKINDSNQLEVQLDTEIFANDLVLNDNGLYVRPRATTPPIYQGAQELFSDTFLEYDTDRGLGLDTSDPSNNYPLYVKISGGDNQIVFKDGALYVPPSTDQYGVYSADNPLEIYTTDASNRAMRLNIADPMTTTSDTNALTVKFLSPIHPINGSIGLEYNYSHFTDTGSDNFRIKISNKSDNAFQVVVDENDAPSEGAYVPKPDYDNNKPKIGYITLNSGSPLNDTQATATYSDVISEINDHLLYDGEDDLVTTSDLLNFLGEKQNSLSFNIRMKTESYNNDDKTGTASLNNRMANILYSSDNRTLIQMNSALEPHMYVPNDNSTSPQVHYGSFTHVTMKPNGTDARFDIFIETRTTSGDSSSRSYRLISSNYHALVITRYGEFEFNNANRK